MRLRKNPAVALPLFAAVILSLSACGLLRAQSLTNLNLNLLSVVKPSANPLAYGDVWGEGHIACLGIWTGYSTYNYGVGIYSISNPSAPQLLSIYNPAPASGLQLELGAVRNRIGYFGSWSGGGIHVVSLTNPASPVQLMRLSSTNRNGFDRVHTVFLERDFLYSAAHVPGSLSVKVFSVTNPVSPVFLRDIVTTNTTKVHQMTVRNKGAQTLLFTSGWGGNDNSNPSSPGQTDIWDVTAIATQPAVWLGRIYSGYNSHSSWPTPDGNLLIVCREVPGGEVKFYDISDPASIPSNAAPVTTITPASMGLEADIPHNPVVTNNLLFVSWYQNGVQVFDISNPLGPVRIGFHDTFPGVKTSNYQGNWGVYPDLGLNRILLSDIQRGMLVLDGSGLLTPTNNYAPLIVQTPASINATQGLSAVIAPVITGSQLKFQWRLNGTNLPAATNSSLSFANVQTNHAGNYAVVVTNVSGAVTSAVMTLSVVVPNGAPLISSQPQDIAVYAGNPAAFSVGVIGASPFTYQWRFNGGVIPGATNSTFTIDPVEAEGVGYYSVTVSNAFGGVVSADASLTLIDSPYVSNVRASPGIRSALVSWQTTVPSSSQVQFQQADAPLPGASLAFGGQSSFSGNSVFDPVLTTNHVVLLTGLFPDTRYSFQTIAVADTNTYVSGVYQFTTPGTNIIDNIAAEVTGTWSAGTSSTDKYSSNYLFATSVSGSATATATWRPDIVTPGRYDVYIWYPQGSNRATNAPFLVSFDGGSTNVPVNQQTGGGAWQLIAANVEFAKGTNGFVRLSNNAGPTVVLADAVRFVYVEAQDFPTTATVPRWWRDFFFGGTNDATLDPDADRYPTAQEYVLGTSPVDAVSKLSVWNANSGGTNTSVTFWPMHAGRSYQLQSKPDLSAGAWQALAGSPVAEAPEGRGQFVLGISNTAQNYFRLKAQLDTNSAPASLIFLPSKLLSAPPVIEESCGPIRIYVR